MQNDLHEHGMNTIIFNKISIGNHEGILGEHRIRPHKNSRADEYQYPLKGVIEEIVYEQEGLIRTQGQWNEEEGRALD